MRHLKDETLMKIESLEVFFNHEIEEEEMIGYDSSGNYLGWLSEDDYNRLGELAEMVNDNQPSQSEEYMIFSRYADERSKMLAPIQADNGKKYRALMTGDIRGKRRTVVIENEDDDFPTIIDEDGHMEMMMITVSEYAARMEFDEINISFLSDLYTYWNDLYMDEEISNVLAEQSDKKEEHISVRSFI